MISYQARKGHGNVTGHEVKNPGDLEFCFNNRHSLVDSKKLVWEFRVLGEERVLEVEEGTNQTSEYLEQADRVRKAVISVRGKVARSKHSQWWLGLKVSGEIIQNQLIVSSIVSSIVYCIIEYNLSSIDN